MIAVLFVRDLHEVENGWRLRHIHQLQLRQHTSDLKIADQHQDHGMRAESLCRIFNVHLIPVLEDQGKLLESLIDQSVSPYELHIVFLEVLVDKDLHLSFQLRVFLASDV